MRRLGVREKAPLKRPSIPQSLPVRQAGAIRILQLKGNLSMDSGHGKKVEFLNRNPFSPSSSIETLAVKDLKRKFKVRISLVERSNKLFHFDIHSRFFLDVVS
jgi:hypothetical protein